MTIHRSFSFSSFKKLMLTAVVSSLLLAVVPTSAHAATDSTAEAKFVELINFERANRGLAELTVRSDLVKVARAHSVDMADQNYLHHNPDLATDVTNWLRLAENVGYGPSVTSLHDAFMNSSGHRANILDSKVTEIGVGVEVRGSKIWVTQIFRLPETTTTSSTSPSSGTDVRPLRGDWDGNGTQTPGWYIDGTFKLSNRLDGSGSLHVFTYGRLGDIPVVGDWNGNGADTVGVIRDGVWHLINTHRGGSSDISFVYGRIGPRGDDVPLVGDWNGDGKDEIGIVRDGDWHLRKTLSGGPGQIVFTYGRVGPRGDDLALIGDWNGDGKDTVGIVRFGEWHLRNTLSGGAGEIVYTYGRVGTRGDDVALIGDWDGDGDASPTVVRDGSWYYKMANSGGGADKTFTWKAF